VLRKNAVYQPLDSKKQFAMAMILLIKQQEGITKPLWLLHRLREEKQKQPNDFTSCEIKKQNRSFGFTICEKKIRNN
jgi:hypothetical protein